MNKLACCLALIAGVAFVAEARPEPPRREPARHHRPAPKPRKSPKVRWGVNISPFGSSLSVGSRIGKHGGVSITLPLTPPPPAPVIREEKTVIVQQAAPVIIQQTPIVVDNGVELNPNYAGNTRTRTWVEGYWKVTRDPNGRETSRTWVPGYWEE